MYEIQKRSKTNPNIWYMIAQTDILMWAKKIVEDLNIIETGEFRLSVRKEEQPIETT